MTQYNKVNKVWTWSVKYNFSTMSNKIQTIVDCNQQIIRSAYPSLTGEGWSSGFLKEWKVYAEINSLQEAPFPSLGDELSESERLSAVLNIEWGSPRFHFCIWSTVKSNPSNNPGNGDWNLEGKHSLIHAFGYPYRIYYPYDLLTNNIAREFGEGCKFGFSIDDVGYGYPNEQDIITTSGNWTQELVTMSPDAQPVIIYIQQTGSSGSSSTTATTPPTISGTPTTDVLLASSTPIVFTIGNLTPNVNFTVELLRGTVVVKTDTLQTTGTTRTYDYSINPTAFIESGTASYTLKVTQGSLGAQSTAFNMVQPRAIIQETSISKESSANVNVRISNLVAGQTYTLNWVYLTPNQTDVSQAFTYTYNPPTGQTYENKTFPGTTFRNYFNGYSAPNTYKIRVKGTNPTFNFLGIEILNVTS